MIKTTLHPIVVIFLLFIVSNSCSTTEEVVNYDLTTSVQPSEGGTVIPMVESFPSDTDVKITATANVGYLFKSWAGASVDLSNSITIKMDSDKQLTAIFEKLEVDADGDGVSDDIDECFDTPEGEMVDVNGCSESQLDQITPLVTSIATTEITSTSFKVDWSLNVGSKGYIQFGTSSGVYIASTTIENNFLDSHVQIVGGTNPFPLNAGTTYYWQIYVEDEFGNMAFSEEQSTTTLAEPLKTFVPDDEFERTLISQGYDDVMDNYVITSGISNVTILELNDKGIRDLTGIEDFIELEILRVEENNLSYLDVSGNLALKVLRLGSSVPLTRNNLTSLDVSSNLLLEELNVTWNSLDTLDLTNNTELKKLGANNNFLTFLDVSQNSELIDLTITNNELTNLNLGNISNLVGISVQNNQLTSIDLSNNIKLKFLNLSKNALSSIDLSQNKTLEQVSLNYNFISVLDVSNNEELNELLILNNRLTSLDITNNKKVTSLLCEYNNLTRLDVKNGNNQNLTLAVFNPLPFGEVSNPNLSCIEVDNEEYSTNNWNAVPYSIYSEDCGN